MSKPNKPKKETTSIATAEKPQPASIHQPKIKIAFYASFILMALILFIRGYNVGYHSDEMFNNEYGKENIRYLTSGLKDTTYLVPKLENGYRIPILIRTYGSFFDMVACSVNHVFGERNEQEYNIRHVLIQCCALLTIFFTGLIVLLLGFDYIYALLAIWFLFLTPTFLGNAYLNAKDIPFAMGYVMTVYFIIKFFAAENILKKSSAIWLAISLGIALSTRVGGIVLVGYFGILLALKYFFDKNLRKLISENQLKFLLQLGLIVVISFVFTLLFWPYLITAPLERLQYSLGVVMHFPQRIPILFMGEIVNTTDIETKEYLWVNFSNTVPTVMLFIFPIGLVMMTIFEIKKLKSNLLIIFLAALFPVIMALKNNAVFYDSWRHLLFVYPFFVIIAVYGFYFLISKIKSTILKSVMALLIAVTLIHPVFWMIKNHPFEYMYYNEISGGTQQNDVNFDQDYWNLCTQMSLEWLIKNDKINETKDTITIATNSTAVLYDLVKNKYHLKKIKVVECGFKRRSMEKWNYHILSRKFMNAQFITDKFEKAPAYHQIYQDGIVVCNIMKRTNMNDCNGLAAMYKGNMRLADSLLTEYYHHDSTCETVAEALMMLHMQKSDWAGSLKFLNQSYPYLSENLSPEEMLNYGVVYANNNYMDNAIDCWGKVFAANPKNKLAINYLAFAFGKKGNEKMANYYRGLLK